MITLRDSVHNALTRIGSVNGSKLPQQADNYMDPLMHEFFVSAEVKSHANKRYDMAKKALIGSGEFDPNTVKPSTTDILYTGKAYLLQLKVNTPPSKVNIKQFVNNLARKGVPQKTIDDAMSDATELGTPAKTYAVLPYT